jgi:hypothetical protein
MKKLMMAALCAAMLVAPALAGECCKKAETAQSQPACCADHKAQAQKPACCADHSRQGKDGQSSCCAAEQARAPQKACPTCDGQSWMMAKPNPNCQACQKANG